MELGSHRPSVHRQWRSTAPAMGKPHFIPSPIWEAVRKPQPDYAKTFLDIAAAFGGSGALSSLWSSRPIRDPIRYIEAAPRNNTVPEIASSHAVAVIDKQDPWVTATLVTEKADDGAGASAGKTPSALKAISYARTTAQISFVPPPIYGSLPGPRTDEQDKAPSIEAVIDAQAAAGGNSGNNGKPKNPSGIDHDDESARIRLPSNLFGDPDQNERQRKQAGRNLSHFNWQGHPSGVGATEMGVMAWLSIVSTIASVFIPAVLPLAITSNVVTTMLISKEIDAHNTRLKIAHSNYFLERLGAMTGKFPDVGQSGETAAMGSPANQEPALPLPHGHTHNSIGGVAPQRPDRTDREQGRWSHVHAAQNALKSA